MAFQNKSCLKEILHFHVRKQKMKKLQRTNIHMKQKVLALKSLFLRGNYSKKILSQVRFYEITLKNHLNYRKHFDLSIFE